VPWQHLRISRFGGPEVLQLVEESAIPEPGPGEVRIRVLAAGTGFTDTMIRRGRYPDFKGPLPFTPGYEIVGVVEKTGAGVVAPREGELVADLCVVGGYAQYAIRPARFLARVPDSVDPAEAVCIPLAYLTAFQMLTRCRDLPSGATILVIGASGTVGTALLDLARHLGLKAIGTCSAANRAVVEKFGAAAIDYRAGDFVVSVRLGLARLELWSALTLLFGRRRALFYSITARRSSHPEEFKADMATLFELLRAGAIQPVVIERLPLAAAGDVHARIDRGGLGGKIVLLPWSA
jgi:NADPH:quinone reductase-like Zn-dependent oxidoreductase